MSDAETQEEPTMEEILASIRRIISEEDAEEAAEEAGEVSAGAEPQAEEAVAEPEEAEAEEAAPEPEEVEAGPEPEPDAEVAEEPAQEAAEAGEADEDVLELTDVVDDDGTVVQLSDVAEEPEPEPEPEPASEPEPVGEDDGLVTGDSEAKASAAFTQLSQTLVSGYGGAENTLAGLVQAMLRPILKEWLDDNLPEIVERMVEQEISRLAGKK